MGLICVPDAPLLDHFTQNWEDTSPQVGDSNTLQSLELQAFELTW